MSGGFLNTITGGKYGSPTTYGLQRAYQKKNEDTIKKTLGKKLNGWADIEDILAGSYKGDVDSVLDERLARS